MPDQDRTATVSSNDERLAAVFVDWWWNEGLDGADTPDGPPPPEVFDDFRSLVDHLARHGFVITSTTNGSTSEQP